MEKPDRFALIVLIFLQNILVYAQKSEVSPNCECLSKPENIKAYDVFDVEKKPEFPGGDAELLKYLAENVHYSDMDSIEDPEPRIYAAFIIDALGKARNLCVLRPIYPDRLTNLEKEVLTILKDMPCWIPGEKNGKKVPVKFLIPVRIHLAF